eukprot:719441-Pelagomonas_calceolata.AAC.1
MKDAYKYHYEGAVLHKNDAANKAASALLNLVSETHFIEQVHRKEQNRNEETAHINEATYIEKRHLILKDP